MNGNGFYGILSEEIMQPRIQVHHNFKPGEIRGTIPLSYGLDSEEEDTLRRSIFQHSLGNQDVPKYLWRFLLADAWIRWKINIIFTKVVVWCMYILLIAAVSGLIIWPSKIYLIEKETLQLEVQYKEEDILPPSLLYSNRKLTEEVFPRNEIHEDIFDKINIKGNMVLNEERRKENSWSIIGLNERDKLSQSQYHSAIPKNEKFKREYKRCSVLQDPINFAKKNDVPKKIVSDEITTSNGELNIKIVDLEKRVQGLSAALTQLQVDLMYKELENQQFLPAESKIRKIVQDEIRQVEEEKLGLPDFALENSGATVIGTPNTKTYVTSSVIQLFGFPLWMIAASPRNAIQASVGPGECWAFHGSAGNLRIQLAAPTVITCFSLYHMPKQISITGDIKSAPQEFSVIGVDNSEMVGEILLGEYEYNNDGPPQQLFFVQREVTVPFSIVELRIHSNYGNEEFTCVYRFQVHGKLAIQ